MAGFSQSVVMTRFWKLGNADSVTLVAKRCVCVVKCQNFTPAGTSQTYVFGYTSSPNIAINAVQSCTIPVGSDGTGSCVTPYTTTLPANEYIVNYLQTIGTITSGHLLVHFVCQ